MLQHRVIPVLLLQGSGIVKTIRFKKPRYVGDPINAVRIFNEKEVDELIVLDIVASKEGRAPDFRMVEDLASECFMPLAYGGGITSVEQIKRLYYLGVEKTVLNTVLLSDPSLLDRAAGAVGSQSIVASIDVKRDLWGRPRVFSHASKKYAAASVVDFAREVAERGAGEIMLNAVDRDGTMSGFDLDLLGEVATAVEVPVIACGGGGRLEHLGDAVRKGASAVAAGSLFVYHGPHRAVLINYPRLGELERVMQG